MSCAATCCRKVSTVTPFDVIEADDLRDGEVVVVGDILQRLVDFGFVDGDLALVGLLKLKDLVFDGAQDLRAYLGKRVLGGFDSGGGEEKRGALVEVVFGNHEVVHDSCHAGGNLRRGDTHLLGVCDRAWRCRTRRSRCGLWRYGLRRYGWGRRRDAGGLRRSGVLRDSRHGGEGHARQTERTQKNI